MNGGGTRAVTGGGTNLKHQPAHGKALVPRSPAWGRRHYGQAGKTVFLKNNFKNFGRMAWIRQKKRRFPVDIEIRFQ